MQACKRASLWDGVALGRPRQHVDSLYSILGYNSGIRTSVILLESTPLNAVHEWQHNRLNHQTDVQICSQDAWVNHESVPAVIGNCSADHNSRCRSSVSRPQTDWLQALTWPPSKKHTAITGTKAKPAFSRKHN
ncbi:hypothetical protein AVEN_88224-1 [Araneus ventricosus]|uniref:Uncharacterized protein n=1 Tax=Araneus ventricosus TaxID=182803 RepID=A0A4Y2VF67_ARAVE|nr:hypothetical protein AVEN_88224-1 [Araneus ventricosus]